MRIISGTAKGRKLFTPPQGSLDIRPTSDRAREALFNILGNRVQDATVLDLFAGTGAFGLEAYSRLAKRIVFIDNSILAIRLIQKNIEHCATSPHDIKRLSIVKHNLLHGIPTKKLAGETKTGIDLIFADPPYVKNISLAVLGFLSKSTIVASNSLVIIEERHTVKLPEQVERLVLTDQRRYGEAAFWFYQIDQSE